MPTFSTGIPELYIRGGVGPLLSSDQFPKYTVSAWSTVPNTLYETPKIYSNLDPRRSAIYFLLTRLPLAPWNEAYSLQNFYLISDMHMLKEEHVHVFPGTSNEAF